MCGIVGFISKDKFHYLNTIKDMTNEILHRGPNMQDYIVREIGNDYSLGFGHARLSILDTVGESGKQPMRSLDGRYTIVFNGEIYNYLELKKQLKSVGYDKFFSNTDTEIILGMYSIYKEKCLEYFNGMFAFAIYDNKTNNIFIARDRLGEKPLYYSKYENTFVFASEIKAILKMPNFVKEVNTEGIVDYIQFRYVRNPNTLFKNVYKLEPGYYIIYKNDKLEKKQYWKIEDTNSESKVSQSDIEELLLDSVKLKMRADVPVGAFLSGGLDSSLVVAMMSKFTDKKINTFSVGFKDTKYSELSYAKIVADYLKTDHHEVLIDSNDIINNIDDCIYYRDEPISEPSEIAIYLLSKEAQKKVTVVLTGEGSDECFGGYPKYAFDAIGENKLSSCIFKGINRYTNKLPFKYRKLKQACDALRTSNCVERYDKWFGSFNKEELKVILNKNLLQYVGIREDMIFKDMSRFKQNLTRMQYYDMKYWLTDNLLDRADKMLMSAPLEGRVPFLDFRLVEKSFLLEDKQKIKMFKGKQIIKKIAEKYIPKEIIYRKKVGFYIPVAQWFRDEMKDYLYETILSERFFSRGLFNEQEIRKLVENHINGSEDNYKKIWMLVCLERWFRVFIDM